MKETNGQLSNSEAGAFAQLSRQKTPPDFLEERIVGALREHQLLRSSSFRWRRRLAPIALALAASVLVFTLGAKFHARWNSSPLKNRGLPEFLLALRNSPRELPAASGEERSQRIREYSAWAKEMDRKGILVAGEKLKDEALLLDLVDGRPVVSELDAEARTRALAGYFLIRARDYQDAIRIAQDCPHARFGGRIEIRQIDTLGN